MKNKMENETTILNQKIENSYSVIEFLNKALSFYENSSSDFVIKPGGTENPEIRVYLFDKDYYELRNLLVKILKNQIQEELDNINNLQGENKHVD